MKVALIGLGKMGQTYLQQLMVNPLVGIPSNIVGVDSDPVKIAITNQRVAGVITYPALSAAVLKGVDAAIVSTNTPSHHTIIRELIAHGVRWILCEKPLAISRAAVEELGKVLGNTTVFTGFQINLSPAIAVLRERMQKERLVLTEANVLWGKSRYMDPRPTPGDLEDETVHGMGVVHALAGVNRTVVEESVFGTLTFPRYANPSVQAKAHAADSSYPLQPNASSRILETLTMSDNETVHVSYVSSFVYPKQVRMVSGLLCNASDTVSPRYGFELNFDQPHGTDVLTLAPMGEEGTDTVFQTNNIGTQTAAFLLAASGGEWDPRLTQFETARRAIYFHEAVLTSAATGKPVVIR